MLQLWTTGAARMCAGDTARDLGKDLSVEGPDGGSALGLSPSRLTITFGFGPGLFVKDGSDRYGLAAKRPAALVDMPKFNGDQLEAALTGGDLSVQACADDPMVAFHAVRELARLSYGSAQFRWAQQGFLPDAPADETARNLMGFKDGTNNPRGPATAPTPTVHGTSTRWSGWTTKAPTGCVAEAMWSPDASASRSSIGIAPRSAFRSR
jgi:deferrochelatase/peroxidase EfeB